MQVSKSRIFQIVVLMVVLPLLAESIYAPGLPALAASFAVSDAVAESTLSFYLFGMSAGVLFWGNLSDMIGRKPVVLLGFGLFLCATIGCYLATDIQLFMLLRFVQAFGGSVSCVGQSINRDVFEQKERMALSAKIGTAVSIAPAVGALLGGVIAQYYGWRESFLCLIVVACVLIAFFQQVLPETKKSAFLAFSLSGFCQAVNGVVQDKNLILNAVIIGLGLGIMYAFMSEGAFYCMNSLALSTQAYGMLCAIGSIAYAWGCRLSDQMIQAGMSFQRVMRLGTAVMAVYKGTSFICAYSQIALASLLSVFTLASFIWIKRFTDKGFTTDT